MLVIRDNPPFSSAKLLRHYFEGAVSNTPALHAHLPLDCFVSADGAVNYGNDATQAAWVGFALGMRCSERIDRAKQAQREAGES